MFIFIQKLYGVENFLKVNIVQGIVITEVITKNEVIFPCGACHRIP